MPNTPKLRNIGSVGVITDLDPHDCPPTAFTFAQNIRFRNARVSSGPVMKLASGTLGTGLIDSSGTAITATHSNPRFLCSFSPSSNLEYLFIGYRDGAVTRWQDGVETDFSVASIPDAAADVTWTSTTLGGVMYINRSDSAPWYLLPSGNQFATIPNMDSAWTCELLRTCNESLVALNVTKGGTANPTLVKTSAIATQGLPPVSWDITQPDTLALENPLLDMQSPIVDAQTLGKALMIYGEYESWLMAPTGDFNVFSWTRLPFTKGAIAANCSIEVNGRNYVFGQDDIWGHDGTTEQSICDGRVRDFIFGAIQLQNKQYCHVIHNQQLHELHFNFPSSDGYASFQSAYTSPGCNRSAVYDYIGDKWTFDDRPCVYFGARTNLDTVATWATVTGTWADATAPWSAYDPTAKKTIAYIGDTVAQYNLTPSLYAFDPVASSIPGLLPAITTYPTSEAASGTPYIERSGVDLSELGMDIRDYTQISYIAPLARLDPSATNTINFRFGTADYYDQDPVYTNWQSYDGETLYKIDVNAAGRFLSYQVEYQDFTPFSFSGFDFDVNVLGSR